MKAQQEHAPQAKQKTGTLKQPVVVVLGHVDHGKSSLLEAIKNFKITTRESGGITQHIGAYEVDHEGRRITFLDTPGHEAFSQMRSRGASVADIALLVVAADEGMKPQTKEAVRIISESGIPFIVVLTKIDKPGIQEDKVKSELASNEVTVESWGGNIPSVAVSAKTKEGIPELLEVIALVAEMQNASVDTRAAFEGSIVESFLDGKRGPTATLIVRQGELHSGDIVGTESAYGKARIMENFQGQSINKALPGQPVVLVGWNDVPRVGERVYAADDMQEAQNRIVIREKRKAPSTKTEEGAVSYSLILKADVAGSLEALEEMIQRILPEEGNIRIIARSVGNISTNDVKLAGQHGAHILAFRVKKDQGVVQSAERSKVRIEEFNVVYHLIEHIRKELDKIKSGESTYEERGALHVAALFSKKGSSQVIGGTVERGSIYVHDAVEVRRGEETVGKGKVMGVKKFQTKTEEAKEGEECGVLYEGNVPVEKGDLLVSIVET